ncbi:unnamed protein product [Sphagnum troendelagicum]|uniref:Uncharacterized protein n=1 Tax=Sphagnum troendelagicum TaxID=128251 RepID=A0ABP0UVM9_9BRYO
MRSRSQAGPKSSPLGSQAGPESPSRHLKRVLNLHLKFSSSPVSTSQDLKWVRSPGLGISSGGPESTSQDLKRVLNLRARDLKRRRRDDGRSDVGCFRGDVAHDKLPGVRKPATFVCSRQARVLHGH